MRCFDGYFPFKFLLIFEKFKQVDCVRPTGDKTSLELNRLWKAHTDFCGTALCQARPIYPCPSSPRDAIPALLTGSDLWSAAFLVALRCCVLPARPEEVTIFTLMFLLFVGFSAVISGYMDFAIVAIFDGVNCTRLVNVSLLLLRFGVDSDPEMLSFPSQFCKSMAGPGSSMLYSFLLFTVILSLQEVYRGKLASSEWFTILGGFTSSLLFLVSLTVSSVLLLLLGPSMTAMTLDLE